MSVGSLQVPPTAPPPRRRQALKVKLVMLSFCFVLFEILPSEPRNLPLPPWSDCLSDPNCVHLTLVSSGVYIKSALPSVCCLNALSRAVGPSPVQALVLVFV